MIVFTSRFDITSKNAIIHERWDERKVTSAGNDIALIKLPYSAVTVNEQEMPGNIVLPICIDWEQSGVCLSNSTQNHVTSF